MTSKYLKSLLGDSEEILLITRQHWFLLVSAILLEVVLTIAVLVGVTFALALSPLAAIGYLLVLFPLSRGLYDFMNWQNVQYVVTNRRVIHLTGVVNKNVTDSSLEKVNDVKMEQPFFGRLFGYGDLEILTASEAGIARFRIIGDPIRFKTTMLNAKQRLGDEDLRPGADRAISPGDIPEMIAELDQLRRQGILSAEEFEAKKRELLKQM